MSAPTVVTAASLRGLLGTSGGPRPRLHTAAAAPVPVRGSMDDVDTDTDSDSDSGRGDAALGEEASAATTTGRAVVGAVSQPHTGPAHAPASVSQAGEALVHDGIGSGASDAQAAARSKLARLQREVDQLEDLTTKYSSLRLRDNANKIAFAAEVAAKRADIEAVVEQCFQKARAGLAGQITDADIREEVAKQVWSHKLMEIHNKLGVKERGDPPTKYQSARAGALLTPERAHELDTHGWTVIDGALPAPQLAALLQQASQLRKALQTTVQKNLNTRDDEIAWFTETEVAAATAEPAAAAALQGAVLLEKGMAHAIEQALGWRLRVPLRAMCSCYPGEGARYVPHRDNSLADPAAADGPGPHQYTNQREVTCILYLNPPDWDATRDGGVLRLHPAAPLVARRGCPPECTGEDCQHVDVTPVGGRMVLFKAKELLHEVLPAYRTRMAVTLWLFCDTDT